MKIYVSFIKKEKLKKGQYIFRRDTPKIFSSFMNSSLKEN